MPSSAGGFENSENPCLRMAGGSVWRSSKGRNDSVRRKGGGVHSNIEDCTTVIRPYDELGLNPGTPRCLVRSDRVLALPYNIEPQLALSSANGSEHLQEGGKMFSEFPCSPGSQALSRGRLAEKNPRKFASRPAGAATLCVSEPDYKAVRPVL
jgi:hypothetical protein